MKSPKRRILSYLIKTAPIWRIGAPARTRAVELHGTCRHVWVVEVMPARDGKVPIPIVAPCPVYPLVPDSRVNAYIEDGIIAPLRLVVCPYASELATCDELAGRRG